MQKIAHVAPHCFIDPTSGAAVATAQAMQFLQSLGFQCRAFSGSRLDSREDVEVMLARHKITYRNTAIDVPGGHVPALTTSLDGFAGGKARPLEVTIVPNEFERQTDFYRACGAFLDADRPDVVITYGGDPMAETLILLAKNRDIPLVFWLHNFAYRDAQSFALADYVIVPSRFNQQFYWNSIGLATQVVPLAVDWERVRVNEDPHPSPLPEGEDKPHPGPLAIGEGKFVTLVNPQMTKGLFVFARIAEQMALRRPDIKFLVMSGRSGSGWQSETGIDLSTLPNVSIWPAVADPRDFYSISKLMLMPSLWNESFGLVGAEAMLNGIPVLASNRGALPETIGDAGFLFDIPARLTPETRELPTVEEVEPWVETIIRLWDDPAAYDEAERVARERAKQWHPDRLASIYHEFFSNITHQSGPPIVPLRK